MTCSDDCILFHNTSQGALCVCGVVVHDMGNYLFPGFEDAGRAKNDMGMFRRNDIIFHSMDV